MFYAGNGWVAGGCWDDEIDSFFLLNLWKDNRINGVNCMQLPFHCIMLIVN